MLGPTQALCSLPILEINEGVGWAGSAGPGDAWPAWVPAQQAWVQGRLCVPGPQRWNPVGGFCEKLLLSDRWGWSDVSGLQHRLLDRVALPSPHWEWESDWYVDENFGGEPTEKGVGELGTLHDCPVGRGCLLPVPASVPCTLWCLSSGVSGRTLPPHLPSSSNAFPAEPESPFLGVSGVDVCHRLSRHLHERQEVEFLCAAPEVDPVQEIQVPGHLGQGLCS